MSPKKVVQETDVLEAAYNCFARAGLRRTTMEDIAQEVGRSRPVVYRYVTDKEDAFRKVVQKLLVETLDQARAAAVIDRPLPLKVGAILEVKLNLVARVGQDSPHHVQSILDQDSEVLEDLLREYAEGMNRILVEVLSKDFPVSRAREIADILLALADGLELNLENLAQVEQRLLLAVEFLCVPPALDGAPDSFVQKAQPELKKGRNVKVGSASPAVGQLSIEPLLEDETPG